MWNKIVWKLNTLYTYVSLISIQIIIFSNKYYNMCILYWIVCEMHVLKFVEWSVLTYVLMKC